MSSSPSPSRRNRSHDLSNRKNTIRERHENNKNSDKSEYNDEKEDGSEFNTRGHGPPKIEGMVSLKVDNITQRTGVNLLKKVFAKFGDLGDIYVPRYPDTFASRGFAFVRYYRKRDAEDAMHAMNGERLDGRILSIQMARYARPNSSKSSSDKHLPSKRSHYHQSDFRRNGTVSRANYRTHNYNDYNDRSHSKRKRSPSRSRDRRKTNVRHRRSRSRSRSRSKDRSAKRRTRYRSRTKSRSRSRSQSRYSSKSLSQEKKNDNNNNNDSNVEKSMDLDMNLSDVKLDEIIEKTSSQTNHRQSRSKSHSNSR